MSLLTLFRRQPDFVIGDGYLLRWWLLPRNPVLNVYLHCIQRDDDDRAYHDHPWENVSILLRGAYREWTPEGSRVRRAGSIVIRRAEALHRLQVVEGPVWTLFITGPRRRNWGFACPDRWVPWQEFTDPTDKSKVGKGCAQ